MRHLLLYTFICLTLAFLSCSDNSTQGNRADKPTKKQIKAESDLDRMVLFGKVKAMTHYTYLVNTSEGEMAGNKQLYSVEKCTFNNDGNYIEYSTYDGNKELTSKSIYTYDTKGILTELN